MSHVATGYVIEMKTRLKILYRKNLKMSPGKLAAQCVHAATGIGHDWYSMPVVVLSASDSKFQKAISDLEEKKHFSFFVVTDAGQTELAKGTKTCLAFYEKQT